MAKNLIVILGPTASGKTRLAARLAYDLHGEIISADSRQVYRNMNIGTGKDLSEYIIKDRHIPYHLIDVVEPEQEFNLFEYQNKFYEIFRDIQSRQELPIMVGGSGLYLEAVICAYDMPEAPVMENVRNDLTGKSNKELQTILQDLKPQLHNRTDLDDRERLIRAIEIEIARKDENQDKRKTPVIDAAIFGIQWERSALRLRVTKRLEARLKQGMIEEVSNLHTEGLSWSKLERFGLEYRFISQYLQKKITFEEMKNSLNTAIHRFAKRQETWFRRMEKKGVVIHWIKNDDYASLKEGVARLIR